MIAINKENLQRNFIPSLSKIFFYLFVSIVILILTNFPLIINVLTKTVNVPTEALKAQLSSNLPLKAIWLNFAADNKILDKLVLIIFWAGIGLLVYLTTLAIKNIIIETEDEIKIENTYVNKGNPSSRLKPILFQLGALAIVIFVMILSFMKLYQIWVLEFAKFILFLPSIVSLEALLISVLGLTINIYLLINLIKFTFLADELKT